MIDCNALKFSLNSLNSVTITVKGFKPATACVIGVIDRIFTLSPVHAQIT